MIKSFADKETEALWDERRTRLPSEILSRAAAKLQLIDAAPNLQFLRHPPSNHLEELKGDRKGQHSIRINDRYRICFAWTADNNAGDVAICDYH